MSRWRNRFSDTVIQIGSNAGYIARGFEVSPRAVDDHVVAAREPVEYLPADGITIAVRLPGEQVLAVATCAIELCRGNLDVRLVAGARRTRDITPGNSEAGRYRRLFADRREQRILARARRTHEVVKFCVIGLHRVPTRYLDQLISYPGLHPAERGGKAVTVLPCFG